MIKEFMIGKTHIKSNDKYCHNKTEEERQAIMQRISKMAYAALVRQEQRKLEEKKKETGASA